LRRIRLGRIGRRRGPVVITVNGGFAEGEEGFPTGAGRIVYPSLVRLRVTAGRGLLIARALAADFNRLEISRSSLSVST
jgi:hypothetical protein